MPAPISLCATQLRSTELASFHIEELRCSRSFGSFGGTCIACSPKRNFAATAAVAASFLYAQLSFAQLSFAQLNSLPSASRIREISSPGLPHSSSRAEQLAPPFHSIGREAAAFRRRRGKGRADAREHRENRYGHQMTLAR